MCGPQAVAVELDEASEEGLKELVRRHGTAQQVALRARIILLAAAGQNNRQIGEELGVTVDMVRLWRLRWAGFAGLALADLSVGERLEDAPRPGKPVRIQAEQVCQIMGLACEAPGESGRPISQWTGREIADEVMRRGIVERISPRHAQRLLKRGRCSPISSAIG